LWCKQSWEYPQILPNLFSALVALAAGVAISEQLLILFHWHLMQWTVFFKGLLSTKLILFIKNKKCWPDNAVYYNGNNFKIPLLGSITLLFVFRISQSPDCDTGKHSAWLFSLSSFIFWFTYSCITVLLDFLVLEKHVYIRRNKITGLSFDWYFVFHLKFCKIRLQFGGPRLRDSVPLTMVEVSQTSNLAPLQFILNINIPSGNAWFNVSHIIAFSCQFSVLLLCEVAFYCTILGDNDRSH